LIENKIPLNFYSLLMTKGSEVLSVGKGKEETEKSKKSMILLFIDLIIIVFSLI
jgi:hypothetical protein